MRVLLFLLMSMCVAQAQSIEDFQVRLEKSHRTVIQNYIKSQPNLQKRPSKDYAVILVLFSPTADEPCAHEMIVGATIGKRDRLPTYITEVDGYAVAITIYRYLDSYLRYPDVYLQEIDKKITSKLKRLSVNEYIPEWNYSMRPETWRAVFRQGEEPEVSILPH